MDASLYQGGKKMSVQGGKENPLGPMTCTPTPKILEERGGTGAQKRKAYNLFAIHGDYFIAALQPSHEGGTLGVHPPDDEPAP